MTKTRHFQASLILMVLMVSERKMIFISYILSLIVKVGVDGRTAMPSLFTQK